MMSEVAVTLELDAVGDGIVNFADDFLSSIEVCPKTKDMK